MARPGVPTSTQPWQSPNPRGAQANALEPIDLPPAIEQGVDMIYIDQELVPHAVQDQGPFANMTSAAWSGARSTSSSRSIQSTLSCVADS